MERRAFVKAVAAAVPLASPGVRRALLLAQTADPSADVGWQQHLRRIGQTNMTEHDPAALDVEAWADYWASLR